MPVELDTLPIKLKFVGISDKDFHRIGHTPVVSHFSKLNAVMFSYPFIRKGLSCSSIFMNPLLPNSFINALVISLVSLVCKREEGNKKFFNKESVTICPTDINPVLLLSNTCIAYSDGNETS